MPRTFYIIILILASLTLVIVGIFAITHKTEDNEACNDTNSPLSIVAFGDSLVEGRGATTQGGFVTILSQDLGVPITNLGVSGNTTADALSRVTDVTSLSPNITLVLLGGNDALQRISSEQTEANLDQIIPQIQASGSQVILLGVIGGFPDPYSGMFKRIASEHKVTYIPNILSGIITNPDLMSDSVHPNQEGYMRIAERVLPVLQKECGEVGS